MSTPVVSNAPCATAAGRESTLDERLQRLVADCVGSRRLLGSTRQQTQGPTWAAVVGPVAVAEPTCLRALAVTSEPSVDATLVVLDARQQPLGRGHGAMALATPADGVLCVPGGSRLTARLNADRHPGPIRLELYAVD